MIESDTVRSGLRSSRVLENENVEILSEKLRRLRFYEKGCSSVFKKFLSISQLVNLALHLMLRQHFPKVYFIINTLLQQGKIVLMT